MKKNKSKNNGENKNFQSELIFSSQLPAPSKMGKKCILIYDEVLVSLSNKKIKTWIERFELRYSVQAGESLKQLKNFPKHIESILELVKQSQTKDVTIVALGGGSLGDFAGFIASVLKRGVPFIQIPSTWLAAIDSSHGGKTALNAGGFKNQIGTFYPANKIFLCKEILLSQPVNRVEDSMGEVLKTILLQGEPLWSLTKNKKKFSNSDVFKILPLLIDYKYKIVLKDPFEKKGLRFVLNFGHTLGHVLEAQLALPHGVAVSYGLVFALEFSKYKKILSLRNYKKINSSELFGCFPSQNELVKILSQVKDPFSYLIQDKKLSRGGKINFIFYKDLGKPIVQEIPVAEILDFNLRMIRSSLNK